VPLPLTLEGSVRSALEANRSLVVERIGVDIAATAGDDALAPFDLVADASLTAAAGAQSAGDGDTSRQKELRGALTLGKYHPSGMQTDAALTTTVDDSSQLEVTRVGVEITQPLGRGASREVNTIAVHQASIDLDLTRYELRGFIENIVEQVETAYWDHLLARRSQGIYETSLELARRQVTETEQRIRLGSLAAIELPAARAEEALRQQSLTDARSSVETTRLRLLRLVNPPGGLGRPVEIPEAPLPPVAPIPSVDELIQEALSHRPDMNQARLQVARGELEVRRTRDGLLPKLDFFVSLGKSGREDTIAETLDLDGPDYDASAGLRWSYAQGERAANAAARRADLSERQSREALANLAQSIELEVRTALVECNRLAARIGSTASTRALLAEKALGEEQKFKVGRSTSFSVAQAQRDLLQGELDEVKASVSYLSSVTGLYRLTGMLLRMRGIEAPGAEAAPAP
jgi:outer membrane protein TolC